jgi:hypothetical protein
MQFIKVEVRGGVVQEVSNVPKGVAIQLWDWDNIKEGDLKPKKDVFSWGVV